MNKNILCKKCEEEVRKQFPTENPYPNEHVKFINGKAKKKMYCDRCFKFTIINIGDDCCAFTIWADNHGIGYSEWESEYIKIKK